MNELPIKLIETVPIAAAMIYLCVVFLRSLDKRDDKLDNIQKEWSSSMTQAVNQSNQVIDRNTDALIEVKGIIGKCRGPRDG